MHLSGGEVSQPAWTVIVHCPPPASQLPTAGASDMATANRIAREMIFRCGFRWAGGH